MISPSARESHPMSPDVAAGSGVTCLIELPPFRNRLPSTPGVAMAIAGGPEARLADPYARGNPGIPYRALHPTG